MTAVVLAALALLTAGSALAVTITNFTPTTDWVPEESNNCVGSQITINGTGFVNDGGTPLVKFNGTPAVGVFVGSDRVIYARVPAGATPGNVTVTTNAGTATSSATYNITPCASHGGPANVDLTASAPVAAAKATVSTVAPTSGKPGTKVTLTGKNFTGTKSVKFRGVAAKFKVVSDTTITVTVPAGAVKGRITVTNAGGTTLAKGPSFVVK